MIPLRRLPATLLLALAACVGEGDTLTLTVGALNGGPTTLDGTSASVTLPAGFVPAAWETSAGSVDPQADVFSWAIGALEAGEPHTLTLDVWIDPTAQLAGRTVSVQAEIFPPQTFQDPNVENNFGEWFVQVVAPLPGGDITTLAFPRLRAHL